MGLLYGPIAPRILSRWTMSLPLRAAAATLALAFGLSAASSVGQITSSESFYLRGKLVQVAGVPSWSALPGDEITAGDSSLMVTFTDGSQATIATRSKARIEQSARGQILFRLLAGDMTVRATATSTTAFYNGTSSLRVRPSEEVTVTFGNSSSAQSAVRRVPPPPPPSVPKPTSTR